nr:uncharacterized protein LOC109410944 [Aedes albopictus]
MLAVRRVRVNRIWRTLHQSQTGWKSTGAIYSTWAVLDIWPSGFGDHRNRGDIGNYTTTQHHDTTRANRSRWDVAAAVPTRRILLRRCRTDRDYRRRPHPECRTG